MNVLFALFIAAGMNLRIIPTYTNTQLLGIYVTFSVFCFRTFGVAGHL